MTHSLDGILAEHRWAVTAGIVALLCVVLVFTDVTPRLGAAAALLGQWRRQTEKLAEVAAWDYEAATIEARRAGLRSRLEDLYVNLPRSEQTSVILQLLQESAAAENVTLDQVRPLGRERRGDHDEIPFKVELTGSFGRLNAFVNRVEQSPYLIKARALRMHRAKPADVNLRGEVDFSVIILREEGAAP